MMIFCTGGNPLLYGQKRVGTQAASPLTRKHPTTKTVARMLFRVITNSAARLLRLHARRNEIPRNLFKASHRNLCDTTCCTGKVKCRALRSLVPGVCCLDCVRDLGGLSVRNRILGRRAIPTLQPQPFAARPQSCSRMVIILSSMHRSCVTSRAPLSQTRT
jgi:hypothetical protein